MDRLNQRFSSYLNLVNILDTIRLDGKVSQVVGLVIEATLPDGTLGEMCEIYTKSGNVIKAEIVGFRGDRVLLLPFSETVGISPGSQVRLCPLPLSIPVGPQLLGRVLDGLGNPIDGKGPILSNERQYVYNDPPNPLNRRRIKEKLTTGIRSIDGLITTGKGQRIGIFSASGVGKSVLLGMMAKYTDAEVNVIGLIGERGREVRDFIERDLGEEGLKRSVVIVATSDQAAMVRVKGALISTAIAEYFREKGKDVMLLMDSLTRVAMAQREIGLAVGEPPTTKGYTPSVFALLPRLLERAGNSRAGSISGLYTVLVEGDDLDEPISDAARAILDGHIVLSRKLATKGHYPAIDVLESVSRLKSEVTPKNQKLDAQKILEMMASYRESEDMINIGAYVTGSNPRVDLAIDNIDNINDFLRQDMDESSCFEDTLSRLQNVVANTGK
ncbi:MAG: flagellar protein export ATPase FliI [Calditrichaeota bacterium]|jgi:flagellum-specific ATP synthase|nr:flagellar protein export ATPase FliI [Calditrichota bacterium]